MVLVDFNRREVGIKLVYYGPPMSGKTTNLIMLHERLDPGARGRLLTLDTHADRTLYFDLLPIVFRSQSGMTIKIKLYTVPGQVIHDSTRKLVLQGADGVVFVADSQVDETTNNNASYTNLKTNLKQNGIDPTQFPMVIQFNKRDLPKVRSDAEISRIAQRGREPVFPATAITGQGVIETFFGLMNITWDNLEEKLQLTERYQLSRADFFESLLKQLRAGD